MPERAIIDTGSKKVVYVEREPGMFEGVEVELGPRQGEYYPVVKGLNVGDKVAAAGGFLIDAETRLNPAAAATYFGASGGPQSNTVPSGATKPRPLVAPVAPYSPDRRSRRSAQAVSEANPAGASNGRGFLAPENLENINQLPEADRKLAQAQRALPDHWSGLGLDGRPGKGHAPRPASVSLLPGVCGQGQAKPG